MPAVENRLADLGWTIVHPQELSIPEQMAQIASAERIAGEQGSALHGIVLLDRPKDLRVDFFVRDPSREDGLYNRNYDTIAAGKGIRRRQSGSNPKFQQRRARTSKSTHRTFKSTLRSAV